MNRAFLVLIVLAVSSCATVSTVDFAVNDPGVTDFIFVDSRPKREKTIKIREQNSSITYLGDENFKPPVPVLLKSKLHEKLGSRLATKNVSLAHLEVSVEGRHGEIDETTYRSSTAGMGIDPISDFFARWIIKGIEGRKLSRYIRVELKGSLDERPFSVVENGFFKNDGEIEVKRIVLLAVDKAVDSIESLLKEQNQ